MGDRGNIAIIQRDNEQVWLYSHWGGHDLFTTLQSGMKAGQPRWKDESYLARIIICHAIPENVYRGETGYGISTCLQDNAYPILVVDIPSQKVYAIDEGALDNRKVPKGYKPIQSWGFSDFLLLDKDIRQSLDR